MRSILSLSALSIVLLMNLNANAQTVYNRLDRKSFNRLAQEINIPLFWRSDIHQTNTIDPTDVAYLQGLRPEKVISNYINQGKFTTEFDNVYQTMVKRNEESKPDPDTIQDPEKRRRALVIKDLELTQPSLIESDFSKSSAEDKAVVQHMITMASLIENIFLRQNGVFNWDAKIPADDTASKTLFYRNHGPFCMNPRTENNPDCNGLPNKPKRIVGIYPLSLQEDKNFCENLQKAPNATDLTQPFAAVEEKNNQLTAVPYSTTYSIEMKAIANELKATANDIKDPKEAPFKTYLLSAAQAFLDNNWYAADESWTKMNATNSKWYLRIGPDEQYWEPCSSKAGFHLSFAQINRDSLIWQEKLDPFKNEMELTLAKLAGAPYQARNVSFHLPDFIDVVLNAGDARHPIGATIGQSLPNSGPVANEGRGRTVVMTNLMFPNEDSRTEYLVRSSSLLCKKTMANIVPDPKVFNMTVVLHEAAHNLGPAHEYKINGKTDRAIFGGPMASMLEELKAETSSHYFTDWLVGKKIIDQKTAEKAHLNGLMWGFGHIAEGMYTAEGNPKTYSQLAAIQFGSLIKSGAVVWLENQMAANNTDRGCFEADLDKFSMTMAQLEKDVLHIKASGDKVQAETLKKEMVDENTELKKLRAIITDRVLRAPSKTLVYSIRQ